MAEQQKTKSETGHSGGGRETFPPFDAKNFPSQILWFAIAFGILYLVMSRVALPRVKKIIDSRAGKIEEDLEAARRMREEANEAAKAYEKTLADAKANAQALAQATRAKVKLEQEAKRQSVETELNEKLKTAELQISEMKAAAMANVSQIASEAASAIVQHFTGGEADPKAVAAAIADVTKL